jgi:uracil-DNA glycosylase
MESTILLSEAQKPVLHSSWMNVLSVEFQQDYFKNLMEFITSEKNKGKLIFPSSADIYNAFNLTPLNKVKVVILGQDPYHGDGQAHGLSFSVKDDIKLPPSLKNMFKELEDDIDAFQLPTSGNLSKWAAQGVLLLNAILTVEAHKAASHQKQGWEQFTDNVIKLVSKECEYVVFLLWGKYAEQKERLIDEQKHMVLKAAHPSPFSAYRGFLGCKHFSKVNEYLNSEGRTAIDWVL